ncbi:MAG: cytochrome c biogenesis protein CcdA [Desulfosarcina sp.]|nr:cytochrome c biogenesis protein CcdA [Desulfobacterales bacterium]
MNEVSLLLAFTAGLVSFLSPCVLPLVPGYVSFISGTSITQLQQASPAPRTKRTVMLNALFFVAGFSTVFILFGASVTWIGGFLTRHLNLFTKGAGILIIFFGAVKLGLGPTTLFQHEMRFNLTRRRFGLAGAFVIGSAFGFGWTPCIGPVLAAILAYAGTLGHVRQGTLLLGIYALGLGVPFILSAYGIDGFLRAFRRYRRHMVLVERVSGLVMVVLGVLIVTDSLVRLPAYFPLLYRFAL